MITKIKKIKNFRVFQDYSWPTELNSFKKYNLIFGWNGSGKTTLSSIFQQIETKKVDPDCDDFEILTTSGLINKQNLLDSSLMIKVYNQNFRDNNISFSTGDANPIYFLGQDNIEINDKIEKFHAKQNSLKNDLRRNTENLSTYEKDLDQLCISQAYTIKNSLHAEGDCEYNNYNKGDFKKKSDLLINDNYIEKIVTNDEINNLKTIISTNLKPNLQNVNINLTKYKIIQNTVKQILDESIISVTIERLKNNDELNSWVKEGFEIFKRDNLDLCPFCEQKIASSLIEKFEKHFNDEYNELIKKIDTLVQEIKNFKNELNIPFPKKIEFYSEFSSEYENIVNDTEKELKEFSDYLDYLLYYLFEKKKNPLKKQKIENEKSFDNIFHQIKAINQLINNHNIKTENFNESIRIARVKIEEHFVAEKLDEYLQKNEKISKIKKVNQDLKDNIDEIRNNIEQFEINLKEHRRPANEINNDLKRYLGRDEIKFKIKDNGYQITRYDKIANALSEGEKTAITFIYFLKTLQENNFKLEEGTVVIDDPISSLDTNSLYYAFQFMKSRTKDSAQLIVLTHNYSFFKEVKNWFKNLDSHTKNEEKKMCFFYMLQNSWIKRKRISSLQCLDKLLLDYDSEYHYLFSLVYKNSISEGNSLENNYLFPNISRRLLESFLSFRVPSQKNLYTRMRKIKFDSVRKDRIYRFVNDNSHSGYINSSNDRDLSFLAETQQVSKDIIDLIKEVDATHFDEMVKIIDHP